MLLTVVATEICDAWSTKQSLVAVDDIFNDKLDFTCLSFSDIIRLNKTLLPVARKFKFFDCTESAINALKQFLETYEHLDVFLGEIESILALQDASSEKEKHTKVVDDLNAEVKNKFEKMVAANQKQLDQDSKTRQRLADSKALQPQPPSSWSSPSTSHTVNGRKASPIQGQLGCLLSTDGYSSGVHTWKLRVISRSSTCMVGVAPSTVAKSGQFNFNSNGFYMNFDGGALFYGPHPDLVRGNGNGSSVEAGSIVTITLNCDAHTVSFDVNGSSPDVTTYSNLPAVQLFLAFDNDKTAGSEIEIID